MMGEGFREIRAAAGRLIRKPGFTSSVVVTLGLGIGAVTTVFSVINAVLLADVPYDDADRLAIVWNRLEGEGSDRIGTSAPTFLDYRERARTFEEFIGLASFRGNLTGDGPPIQIEAVAVTPNFFDVVGADALRGRTFVPEDVAATVTDSTGQANVTGRIVVSHGLWQRRFGADVGIVGRTIIVDGEVNEIVGVMPDDFGMYVPAETGLPAHPDAFVLMDTGRFAQLTRRIHWVTTLAKLSAGTSMDAAQRDLDRLAAELRDIDSYHEGSGVVFELEPLRDDLVADTKPVLLTLMGAVLLVLLIACSNVANLLLLRATDRREEFAVRMALGSGRGRLILSTLTESLLLALAGGALGIVLAMAATRSLTRLGPQSILRFGDIGLDGSVVGVAVVTSVLSALVVAMLPGVQMRWTALGHVLRQDQRGGVGRSGRLREGLVVTQMGLSVVLLVGTGLLLRTFVALQSVDPGFDGRSLTSIAVSLPSNPYQPDRDLTVQAMTQVADRLQALSGVSAVSGVSDLPLSAGDEVGPYALEVGDDQALDSNRASYRVVLPGFFDMLDIELLSGRPLMERDMVYGRPVVVIDEVLARDLWGGADPVGRFFAIERFRPDQRGLQVIEAEVVGVVRSTRYEDLAQPGRPAIYVPLIQRSRVNMNFLLETSRPLGVLLPEIREAVATVESSTPVHDVVDLDAHMQSALAGTRFVMSVGGSFALMALILATVGLFGVVSYAVRDRTREIGVRMALGADQASVLRMVLGRSMLLAVLGVGLGVLLAAALSGALNQYLYDVPPRDPMTFLGASGVLTFSALMAALLPARRATSIDPRTAIATE